MDNEAWIPLDAGAGSQTPKRIVVHCMAEYLDTEPTDFHTVDFLRKSGISAHAFVTPSGVVVRSRRDDQGAWHAKSFNTDSLGVEFLVPGVHTYATFLDRIKTRYLTKAQYASGVELVRQWRSDHDIENVDRHSDLSPGRKLDPGRGFPWTQFLSDTA